MKTKYITFAVPSYNSEDYLERCIDSLLPGGEDVEIIIINDGSKDNTAKIADKYAKKYPKIIKAVHKENGGHGSGVNAGIENATGLYYKVVDSDDWVDNEAYLKLLEEIKNSVEKKENIDLFISNYVYNRLHEGVSHTVNYKNLFKSNEISSWNDIGKFRTGQYLIMHALTYKTQVLRESKTVLPKHTFYVDNIFAHNPLPYVKKIKYLDLDLYQYFIGREDQSVNEETMIKRIDQQFKVAKIVIDCHNIEKIKKDNPKLAKCMTRNISIMMTISSVLSSLSKNKEDREKRKELWNYLKVKHEHIYNELRFRSTNVYLMLPYPINDFVGVHGYRLAKKKFMFA